LDILEKSGFQVVGEGLKVMWNPDEENIKRCIEYGETLSDLLS